MAGSKRSLAELGAGAAVLIATAGFMAYAAANTGRGIGGSGIQLSAKFENVGAIASGADVRIAGVKVGSVVSTTIDPQSFQAVVRFTVQSNVELPDDSNAVISTSGLLGGTYLSLTPGGSDKTLAAGGVVKITQSASNFEDLLGKFIFNVGSLADATQKSLDQNKPQPPK